jgi:uncharacterized phiE125 gp8 family phage protein
LALTTGPAVEPVTAAELKDHCRIDTDADDDYIDSLLLAARLDTEMVQHRQLITATYTLKMDRFPREDYIDLPRPPAQSVTSITYVDDSGVTQTLSASTYTLDAAGDPGRVYLNYDYTWPSIRGQRNAVTVVYVAGYGDTAADVPETTRHSIRLKAAHWYENREPVLTGSIATPIPDTIRRLDNIDKFRGTINAYESGYAST